MKSRISARLHKETQRRKTALESSTLPAKLADCRSTRRRAHRAVHRRGRQRARHRQARPAAATTRRCCRSAARSSTSRRPRSPTCSATPSAPRSSRSSAPGSGRTFDLDVGPLRQGHHHDRRRRRRRPHPHPAADAVLPLHAPARRGRPGLRRGAAAAPHRGDQRRRRKANEVIYTYSEAEMRRTMASLEQAGQEDQSRCSATRASARWMPTSWPRRRWTRATAPCARSRRATLELRRAGVRAAHGRRRRRRARTSSSTPPHALDRERIDA